MNSKNEEILIQGSRYKPKEIGIPLNENEIRDVPVGSNPDGKFEPDAFCRCLDDMIESGKLHTKDGILIGKRIGKNYYDKEGKLIE